MLAADQSNGHGHWTAIAALRTLLSRPLKGACALSETAENVMGIPQPEPDLTPEERVRRARDLRRWLGDRQDQTERLAGVPDDTHKAFLEAGLLGLGTPR
jgi:hypothetical protein